MNCLRCNTENEEGVKFCKNCGMDMTYTPSNENSNSTSSDKLLITYLCIAFFVFISTFAIDKLVDNPYEVPINYVRGSLQILGILSMILIPLSIKNKSLKIRGLILTIIMAIYWTYGTVEFMIS
jgi:hypothetical protein